MMLAELRKGINSNPELGLEHGNAGWKYINDHKVMEILRRGFKMMKERKILMPHLLKRSLRGSVCYKDPIQLTNFRYGRGVIKFLLGRPKASSRGCSQGCPFY